MTGAQYSEIAAYKEQHPNKIVYYTVTISGGEQDIKLKHNSTSVTLTSPDQITDLMEQSEYLQALQTIDFAELTMDGSTLNKLSKHFPNAQLVYNSVSVLNSTYPTDTTTLSLSDLTQTDLHAAASALPWLTNLEAVDLTAADSILFTAEDAAIIAAALPNTSVNMRFDLFGQEVSTDMERIEYFQADIGGDAGLDVIRSVMPIMDKLTYLKLDWCGTTDEATAALREELKDQCKVVWRVFITDRYNALTDTYKIWANFVVWGTDLECLKYCNEVRYVDLGHTYIDNCEFVQYMPYLNTLIIADSRVKSLEPLRSCENLTYLEFFTTFVTDISPLADLEQLEYINMSYCKIKDISPIYNLNNLIMVNCTMADVPTDQVKKFKELHPDTKATFNIWDHPTSHGWRDGNPRYQLLRKQIGYSAEDYSRYPKGYLTEEVTYESTGITPPEAKQSS